MAKTKKPDIEFDLKHLRIAYADAKMNVEGLMSRAERRLNDALKQKDLVGYGMELAYCYEIRDRFVDEQRREQEYAREWS